VCPLTAASHAPWSDRRLAAVGRDFTCFSSGSAACRSCARACARCRGPVWTRDADRKSFGVLELAGFFACRIAVKKKSSVPHARLAYIHLPTLLLGSLCRQFEA